MNGFPHGHKARVGVTESRPKEISDVVFVELAKGHPVEQGKRVCRGSVRRLTFTAVSGTITDANGALEANPGLVNQDPYNDGWLFELEVSDPLSVDALMTSAQYAAFVQSGSAH